MIETLIPVVSLRISIERNLAVSNEKIYGIEQAQPIFYKLIGNSTVEKLAVLCLDSNMNTLNVAIIHIGMHDTIDVLPSEIFRVAILSNASFIIIAHNHPSGILEPSEKDIQLTKVIGVLGRMLKIKLVDSLILGIGKDCTSIRTKINEKG